MVDLNDPELLRKLALVFLEAQLAEQQQKRLLLGGFDFEEGKQLYETFPRQIARFYESRTPEQLEDQAQNAAIAVGVAAAIRWALMQ